MEVFGDEVVKPRLLLQLFLEFCLQLVEPFLEIEIVLFFRQPYITAGGENIVELPDPFYGRGVAEPLYVLIITVGISPTIVGLGDRLNILWGEFAGPTVDEVAHIPGVDEEDLVCPISIFSVGLVPAQEPEACRDLGVQEEL